jgi:crotonobetainyl-CoA:carnitine CoA-transferase CaiB-like acyl-CoA transferase
MPETHGSLDGLKVIDLSRVLAGPFCAQMLGDHGADVIKVEPPAGDDTRAWGPPYLDGTASYFIGLNRNKRAIVLDFMREDARVTLLGMLETADVLVENFKTGTLARWGMDDEFLRRRFPRLVHCRISGFGADGPLGGLPGYDAVIQAMGGLMSVNGEPGGGPLRVGVPIVDLTTGLNAMIGILLALQERERSGLGQLVDVALYDCGIALLHPQLANFFLSGKTPARTGNAHPNVSPYDLFATRTAPVFLGVGNEAQFRKLCEYLQLQHVAADPRFATNGERSRHREALRATLESRLALMDADTLAGDLNALGVPCGPVQDLAAVVAHPHTRHRNMVVETDGVRTIGSPVKLSRTPASYRRRPPALGEHDEEILGFPQGSEPG